MPIYRYQCDHGHIFERFLKLSNYEEPQKCECGLFGDRQICPPLVMGDIEPYQSMIDGSMITSRSRHREHLRDHGCIEIGNETKHLKPKPIETIGLKETLINVAAEKLRY